MVVPWSVRDEKVACLIGCMSHCVDLRSRWGEPIAYRASVSVWMVGTRYSLGNKGCFKSRRNLFGDHAKERIYGALGGMERKRAACSIPCGTTYRTCWCKGVALVANP